MAENKSLGSDLKTTAVTRMIRKAISGSVKLIPNEFYRKYIGKHSQALGVILPGIGILIKQLTNLSDKADDFVTECFEELTQGLDIRNIEDKNIKGDSKNPASPDNVKKIIRALLSIKKSGKDIESLVKKINEILTKLDDVGYENFVTMIAGLSSEELVDFLNLTDEEKDGFIKTFFSMIPEKSPEDENRPDYLDKIFDSIENVFKDVKKEINELNDILGGNTVVASDNSGVFAVSLTAAQKYRNAAKKRYDERKKPKTKNQKKDEGN